MSKEDDNEWKGVLKFIGSVVLIAGTVLFFLIQEMKRQEEHSKVMDARYLDYIAERKCVRTGFAGKNALSIYQCEHGMYLSSEIWHQVKLRYPS